MSTHDPAPAAAAAPFELRPGNLQRGDGQRDDGQRTATADPPRLARLEDAPLEGEK